VLAVFVVFVVGLFVFGMKEPLPPYAFLKKYPIVEHRSVADGKMAFLVLKGNFEDVTRDADAEFAGKVDYMSSSGSSMFNGAVSKQQQTKNYGLTDGMVSISTDLTGANLGEVRAGDPGTMDPESKDGYCAIAYARPKSFVDKLVDWVKGVFGGKPQEPVVRPARAQQAVGPL